MIEFTKENEDLRLNIGNGRSSSNSDMRKYLLIHMQFQICSYLIVNNSINLIELQFQVEVIKF